MLALKIPLIGLICIVWWAIKQEPERGVPARGRRRHQARPPAPAPAVPAPAPPRSARRSGAAPADARAHGARPGAHLRALGAWRRADIRPGGDRGFVMASPTVGDDTTHPPARMGVSRRRRDDPAGSLARSEPAARHLGPAPMGRSGARPRRPDPHRPAGREPGPTRGGSSGNTARESVPAGPCTPTPTARCRTERSAGPVLCRRRSDRSHARIDRERSVRHVPRRVSSDRAAPCVHGSEPPDDIRQAQRSKSSLRPPRH